jgi:hypothetical protein
MQVEIHSGIEQTCEDPRRFFGHSTAGQAARDPTRYCRPSAAVVITHWVVPRLRGGNRADAPTGKRLGSQKRLSQPRGPFLKNDSRKKALPGVRRPTPARALVTVDGQGIGSGKGTPLTVGYGHRWCLPEFVKKGLRVMRIHRPCNVVIPGVGCRRLSGC